MLFFLRKNNMSTPPSCVPRSAPSKSPPVQLPKPGNTVVLPEPLSKFCLACKTSTVHQLSHQVMT